MNKAVKSVSNYFPRLSVLIISHSLGWRVPPVLTEVRCIDGHREHYMTHPVGQGFEPISPTTTTLEQRIQAGNDVYQ